VENLKIRVNSEVESKEAQELFFELGYEKGVCSTGGYPALIIATPESRFQKTPFSSRATSLNHEAHSQYKEITLPELRDLVVLKRNDVGDATHESPCGELKFILLGDWWNLFTGGKWQQFCHAESPRCAKLKPIEKTMKEYLRKNSNGTYSYIGTVRPEHVSDFMIEIPEGAIKATFCNGFLIFWKDNSSWNIDGFNSKKWRENDGFDKYMENYKNTVKILWQRPTHPEELPFIDDEPKIETATGYQLDVVGSNTYGSRGRYDGESDISYRQYLMNFIVGNRTESLNDQYAEIETVRKKIRENNHYFIDVSDVDEVDFYEIAKRYNVTDPAIQHILESMETKQLA